MIGWMKELPDWATGALAAGGLWFGVSYVVLAPRAIEAEALATHAPACVAALEQEDAARIRTAQETFEDERRRLRSRLAAMEQQLAVQESAQAALDNSGANNLMHNLGVDLGGATKGNLARLREQIRAARASLAVTPDFMSLATPAAELAGRCTCAAVLALSGQRMSHAVSLAAFRTVSPAEIGERVGSIRHLAKDAACASANQEGRP